MKTLTKIYSGILSVLAVVGMIGYIVSVVVQVFSRTFLPNTPTWTEEAARYLFIYSVAVGAGIVVLLDDYARVDIIYGRFKPELKKIYNIIVTAVLLAFNVFMAVYVLPNFVFLKFRMVSTAMQIPMQYIYFSIMLFVILQAVACVLRICLLIANVDWKAEVTPHVDEDELAKEIEEIAEIGHSSDSLKETKEVET